MLRITVPPIELYSDAQGFVNLPECTLKLEHSLLSLTQWEAKWHKPFYANKKPTSEESLDYIRCMTLNPEEVHPLVYSNLTSSNIETINNYMNDKMTATWFSKDRKPGGAPSREVITSELIYYWMVALQIPFQPCESWHINHLLTLIEVCNEKNKKPTKIPKSQQMSRNRALNAARRKRLNTKG